MLPYLIYLKCTHAPSLATPGDRLLRAVSGGAWNVKEAARREGEAQKLVEHGVQLATLTMVAKLKMKNRRYLQASCPTGWEEVFGRSAI